MRSRQNPLYRLLDKDYCESFDAYVPHKADFHDMVSSLLPAGWKIDRNGIWFHCIAPRNDVPVQGWKIHVSAAPDNAREILRRVSSLLLSEEGVDFKFALDMSVFFLLNGKSWSRGGSGKFITVYPRDNSQFLELIEKIHLATQDMRGAYILSDQRYKDSRVVFYRYGGMQRHEVLTVTGERTPMLIGPDGTQFPDERRPYPVRPPWVSEVLPEKADPEPAESSVCLRNGRYEVHDVLSFSNAGGVYRALDRESGRQVVVKEARPYVNATPDGSDAVALLKKEHRLLTLLEGTGIAPRPIDLFEEWEHWFLVEEFVDGLPLTSHSAKNNILLRTRPREEDFHEWLRMFLGICSGLIRMLSELHCHNVVFADLSTSNMIVESATGNLRLIDFEGAFELGVDRPSSLYTPGFASQNRLSGCEPAMEDDYYAAGAVLMAYLMPVNTFFHLRPEAKREMMSAIQRDSRLPAAVAGMILDLMGSDPAQRLSAARALEVLDCHSGMKPEPAVPEKHTHDYSAVLEGIVANFDHVASYSRRDRLFPSDQKMFVTNPAGLAYGAGGVMYALSRLANRSPEKVSDWILHHKITPDVYAPGLYVGMSGIAWSLLEVGRQPEAEEILRRTFDHPLTGQSGDMFHGVAGWGMTCLRFFLETGNQLYLDKAKQAGRQLLDSRRQVEGRCCWGDPAQTSVGFAHGASGIACFLLYLYLADGNEEFLSVGQSGLEFDLSLGVETRDKGLSWRQSAQDSSPLYPYWQFGSVGVGTTLLRYWRVLGDDRYRSVLEKIFVDVDRRYAVAPGKFMGLAGLGDFALDMFEVTREDRFLEAARRVAAGVMRFRVERLGTAFPGDSLSRLSCSYASGSAGIGLFLRRLSGWQGSDFMLDSLLRNHTTTLNVPSPQNLSNAQLLRSEH